MAGKVPSWKPAKGTMSGRDYGKAVSESAKMMGAQQAGGSSGMAKAKLPKKPPKGRPPVSY